MVSLRDRVKRVLAAADGFQALELQEYRRELRSLSDAELEERIAVLRAEIGEGEYASLRKEVGCPAN